LFREQLFLKRRAAKMTQAMIAKKAGIGRSTYAMIELGRMPSFRAASGIARALNVSVEDIFLPCNVHSRTSQEDN
jgi:DNA-binding XRE family transcriptional regulator